jgi:hypothetical protein
MLSASIYVARVYHVVVSPTTCGGTSRPGGAAAGHRAGLYGVIDLVVGSQFAPSLISRLLATQTQRARPNGGLTSFRVVLLITEKMLSPTHVSKQKKAEATGKALSS